MNTFRLLRKQNYILAAIAVLCFAAVGFAQTESARIQGTVNAAAGAIVSSFDGFGIIRGTYQFTNHQIQFGLRLEF